MPQFKMARTRPRASTSCLIPTFVAILAMTAANAVANDWKSFRGPNGNGAVIARDATPATALNLRWLQPIGSAYSGLSIAGGRLVTCAARDGQDMMIALDIASGIERWAVPLGEAYIGHGGSRDGNIATPAIADGVAYAFSNRGTLVAVDVATGKEQWRKRLIPEERELPYYGLASSPAVHGKLLFLQIGDDEGAVVAVERETGEIAWTSYNDGVDTQSPKIIELHGEPQLVIASNSWVAGLDPAEGSLLWRWSYETRSSFVRANSPLPIGDNRIFFNFDDNNSAVLEIPRVDRSKVAEEVPEATVVWEQDALSRTYSPPVAANGSLMGYTSRFLASYSQVDGSRQWRSRAPGDGFLIAVGKQLAVITKDGTLALGNVTTEGWSDVASEKLFEDLVWTPPSFYEDEFGPAVYVRSMTEIARVDLLNSDTEAPTTLTDAGAGDSRDRQAGDVAVPALLSNLIASGKPSKADIDQFLEDIETPIVSGDRALFLWRGEATDVGIAGDLLGMRKEGAFQRLADTDLWWYQTSVDPRLQHSYILYVDYEPTLDPLNPRVERTTIMGLNANWDRGQRPEMSLFAGPAFEESRPLKTVDGEPGTMTEVEVKFPDSVSDRYRQQMEKPTKVWLPPSYDANPERRYKTAYVPAMFGALEPDLGRWQETLDSTVGKYFEPVIVVFLEGLPPRGESLQPTVDFFDEKFRTQGTPESRAFISMGRGSLPIMATSLQQPDVFRMFGIQTFLGFDDERDMVLKMLDGVPPEDRPTRGYMEWGIMDIHSPTEGWDLRQIGRDVFEGFQERGVDMRGGEVVASTDWKSWRQRTHVLLGALFPPTQ